MFHQIQCVVTRRQLFSGAGLSGLSALVAIGMIPSLALPIGIQEEIRKVVGNGEIIHKGIILDVPEIAENSSTVPIKVIVDHPMQHDHFIESIAILVVNNPIPLAAKFRLTPKSGKAEVALRIKMGGTSMVYAVARTNQGELLEDFKEIKVSIGGCGG